MKPQKTIELLDEMCKIGWIYARGYKCWRLTKNEVSCTVAVSAVLHHLHDRLCVGAGWGSKGEELYDKMPANLRTPLEGKWGSTVTVKPAVLEEGAETELSKVRASQILKDTSIDMLKDFGESKGKRDKLKDAMGDLIKICLGAFGLYFIEHALKWF